MTLSNGREFLSIPGPTTVPDEVLNAMHRPAVDIYAGSLIDLTASLFEDLPRLFRTKGDCYVYAANGHGAWEAALVNVLSRGDKVLVCESGRFAVGWGETASVLGVTVEALSGDWRRAVDPAALEARLRADSAGEIKAVMVVQIDTASGAYNNIAAIRRAIDDAGHGALLMVDTIASLGCVPFEMDEWGVDVAVAGSQKGLMMAPGLSFIAAGPKAKQANESAGLRTRYWDWRFRDGDEHYQKYCGTAPEHMMFGLRKSLDLLLEEGLDNVYTRHRLLAEAVRRAVDVWRGAGGVDFNISEPTERADSVTTIVVSDGHDPQALKDYCHQTCGVVLGTGLGALTGKAFRIAHMGHVNAPMILGTLSVVEIGLAATGIPHTKGGVQAAIDWLAESVPA